MRDALSLTDQAIAYGGQTVNEAEVRAMLGAIDQSYLYKLLDALIGNDGNSLINQAKAMEERSISFDTALNDFAQLLHQIAVAQTVPESVADDLPEREMLLGLAQKIKLDSLQLYYQIALLGRRDLGLAPDEFAGFTMSLLRMLAFTPNEGNTAVTNSKPQASPAATPAHPSAISSPPPAEIRPSVPESVVQQVASAPHSETLANQQDSAGFDGNWRRLVDELKLGLARELAKHCELVNYDENTISLSVPEAQKHLLSPNYQEKLGSAIAQYFDKKIKLQFNIGGTGNTPAKQISQERAEAQANAENAIEEDGFVQALINDFGATIIPNSIKPISN
jgi:DNA polymerase-3 subunit gamma/tau